MFISIVHKTSSSVVYCGKSFMKYASLLLPDVVIVSSGIFAKRKKSVELAKSNSPFLLIEADSFYKVQKNSYSSFEVICCGS